MGELWCQRLAYWSHILVSKWSICVKPTSSDDISKVQTRGDFAGVTLKG